MSHRYGTLGQPRPLRTSLVERVVPVYPTDFSYEDMTQVRPDRSRITARSSASAASAIPRSSAAAPTVISQVRQAKRRARIQRIAFGFLFVANAIMLGTILGLVVAASG
jgi:hypothetical protein